VTVTAYMPHRTACCHSSPEPHSPALSHQILRHQTPQHTCRPQQLSHTSSCHTALCTWTSRPPAYLLPAPCNFMTLAAIWGAFQLLSTQTTRTYTPAALLTHPFVCALQHRVSRVARWVCEAQHGVHHVQHSTPHAAALVHIEHVGQPMRALQQLGPCRSTIHHKAGV
jgi:hypothetical protein